MPVFVLLFGIILVFAPIWAILQSAFMTRVRKMHPEIIQELGTPGGAFDYSLLDMIRSLGFVLRRRYRLLGDKTLKAQADILLVMIVVVLLSWVALIIIPAKTFFALPL